MDIFFIFLLLLLFPCFFSILITQLCRLQQLPFKPSGHTKHSTKISLTQFNKLNNIKLNMNTLTAAAKWLQRCDKQHGVLPRTLSKTRAVFATLTVSMLFFSWGFTYGLLDVMNAHVRDELHLSSSAGATLAVAYYVAYLFGPVFISGPLIKKCGYRPCFLLGILLLTVGAFAFSSAADKLSKELLGLGMHIAGHGVAALERGANPYVTNCGPVAGRTLRILFAQSMAGVGTVVSPLIARAVLFSGGVEPVSATPIARHLISGGKVAALVARHARPDLGKTVQLYNYVGFICLGMLIVYALVFYRTNLVPEIPVESSPQLQHGWEIWKHEIFSLRYSRLWAGCFCNFFNMSCQVTLAQYFMDYMETAGGQTRRQGTAFLSVAQGLFVVGRLASFGLISLPRVRPRFVLLAFISGAIATIVACVFSVGSSAIAAACLAMFFEAPSFPMIFDAATVGLGPFACMGESMMIVSISGGSLGPPLFGILNDRFGVSDSWIMVAGFFGIVWLFPFLTNVVPSWRRAVDLEQENKINDDDNLSDPEAGGVEKGQREDENNEQRMEVIEEAAKRVHAVREALRTGSQDSSAQAL